MTRILSAHQPNFAPWLGWWEKYIVADVFVLMDEVQYERRGYTNRVQLTAPGGPKWLTLPVRKEQFGKTPISHILLQPDWEGEVRDKLYGWYPKKTKVIESLIDKMRTPFDRMLAVNSMSLAWSRNQLGLFGKNKFRYGTEVFSQREKTDRIIDYCKKYECDVYFSGSGAKDYLDVPAMNKEGIQVVWQGSIDFQYEQKHSDEFTYGMSILDGVLNDADFSPFIERALEVRKGIL